MHTDFRANIYIYLPVVNLVLCIRVITEDEISTLY